MLKLRYCQRLFWFFAGYFTSLCLRVHGQTNIQEPDSICYKRQLSVIVTPTMSFYSQCTLLFERHKTIPVRVEQSERIAR